MRNEFQRHLNELASAYDLRTVFVQALRPCAVELKGHHAIRTKTIYFETEDKDGYTLNMFLSPKYTLSERLQAGVKLWFFDAYYGCLRYLHFIACRSIRHKRNYYGSL